jgi:hypothetical protein
LQHFKKWIIFSLIQSLHLAILYWSTWSTSAGMVNMKVVHFHMVLDDMAIVDQGWFEEKSKPGGKVGNIL